MLPISRRDVERLHQIMAIQPKLLDIAAPLRAQRGVLHRSILDEALTWLEIHGENPEIVAHWRELKAEAASHPRQPHETTAAEGAGELPFRRRRRRRRRRRGNYDARS